MVKIVVCRPSGDVTAVHNFEINLYNELSSFYNLLEEVLEELEINYEIKTVTFGWSNQIKGAACLGHHNYNNQRNVWTIKRGYLTGYLYFDKRGYSGWSEGLRKYNPEAKYSEKDIEKTLIKTQYYVDNNISKIPQPKITNIPKKPYVIVFEQKPGDSVSKLSYIRTEKLGKLVTEAYKDTDINVYIKAHPGIRQKGRNRRRLVEGSIHELIKDADAIYTVNSGTGFEALLQGKQVYTAGGNDYSIMTTVVKSAEDIYNTRFQEAPSMKKIGHFLHYCLTEHFVDAFDKKSIAKKVDRVINEFK